MVMKTNGKIMPNCLTAVLARLPGVTGLRKIHLIFTNFRKTCPWKLSLRFQSVGLAPDITVINEHQDIKKGVDNALEKAINLLN